MGKGRLEAFSDGVLAIIITIMVLELKVPHGNNLQDLKPLLPVFLSYVLSFIYLQVSDMAKARQAGIKLKQLDPNNPEYLELFKNLDI